MLFNKLIRPAVYLTFKQRRWNQKTIEVKCFFDKNLKKNQNYSSNLLLKDKSIIVENFSKLTTGYKLVKKAKSR